MSLLSVRYLFAVAWRHRGVTTTDASRLVRSRTNNSCRRLPKHTHTQAYEMRTTRWAECAHDCLHTRQTLSESEHLLCLDGATNEYTNNEEKRIRRAYRPDFNNNFHFVYLRTAGSLALSPFSNACMCVRWLGLASRWKINIRVLQAIATPFLALTTMTWMNMRRQSCEWWFLFWLMLWVGSTYFTQQNKNAATTPHVSPDWNCVLMSPHYGKILSK